MKDLDETKNIASIMGSYLLTVMMGRHNARMRRDAEYRAKYEKFKEEEIKELIKEKWLSR